MNNNLQYFIYDIQKIFHLIRLLKEREINKINELLVKGEYQITTLRP